MTKITYLLAFTSLICLSNVYGQEDSLAFDGVIEGPDEPEYVEDVFSSTRIINGHSTEMLEKKVLEFKAER